MASKQRKINRKVVMSEANAMFRNGNMTRSDAVKQGYKVAKIYSAFAAGMMATITFIKADGSERVANALPASVGEYLVKGTGTHNTPKANILFCDADLGGAFRSLVKARIVKVD